MNEFFTGCNVHAFARAFIILPLLLFYYHDHYAACLLSLRPRLRNVIWWTPQHFQLLTLWKFLPLSRTRQNDSLPAISLSFFLTNLVKTNWLHIQSLAISIMCPLHSFYPTLLDFALRILQKALFRHHIRARCVYQLCHLQKSFRRRALYLHVKAALCNNPVLVLSILCTA